MQASLVELASSLGSHLNSKRCFPAGFTTLADCAVSPYFPSAWWDCLTSWLTRRLLVLNGPVRWLSHFVCILACNRLVFGRHGVWILVVKRLYNGTRIGACAYSNTCFLLNHIFELTSGSPAAGSLTCIRNPMV